MSLNRILLNFTLLLFTTTAFGGVITQSRSYSGGPDPFIGTWSIFDPQPFEGAPAGTVRARIQADIWVQAIFAAPGYASVWADGSLAYSGGSFNFASGDVSYPYTSYFITGPAQQAFWEITEPASLALLTTAYPFTFTLSAEAGTTIPFGGDAPSSPQALTAYADVQVEYFTPEPQSLLLVLTGVVAMFAISRRRPLLGITEGGSDESA